MKRKFTIACTLVFLTLVAIPASASIILVDNNTCSIGCDNILFQNDDIGNPLQASTQNGSIITLSQDVADGNLFAPSNGQARVEQEAGLDYHGLFMDLSGTTTTLLQFTVQPLMGQDAQNGTLADLMDVTINDNLGNVFHFTLGSVGENRHTFQAIDNQSIVGVQLQFLNGTVNAVEQIRLVEGETGGGGGGSETPEPVSVLLTGSALVGISVVVKRRRRGKQV